MIHLNTICQDHDEKTCLALEQMSIQPPGYRFLPSEGNTTLTLCLSPSCQHISGHLKGILLHFAPTTLEKQACQMQPQGNSSIYEPQWGHQHVTGVKSKISHHNCIESL